MAKLILGLYEDWCHLDERVETVTGEIEELSRVETKCQRLMSVPGIGPVISTGLVAAIGTGEAFERGRDFGAWLGLVPRQHSTGGRSVLGRLSKRGSKYLRKLIIQGARAALPSLARTATPLGGWLRALLARAHGNCVVVALASKLIRIAWALLRHETRFAAGGHAAA